jgi:DNA-binding SARP family transcriptional activator/tetratricopeptide (TPR) repeat protein
VEFRVLGPVEVRDADQGIVTVAAARVRTLLATLLLRPRQVVSVDQLIERLWDADPPANPTATVQTYVKRLRRIIGADLVQTRPPGYLIEAAPADLVEFRRLVESAPHAADAMAERDLLERALDLWRDAPLADVDSASLHTHEVPRLVEERLAAIERLMDVRLRLGDHQALVSELTALARTYRQRERFTAQLMVALYRSGRAAEALAAHDELADALADDLGIDTGPELRRLRQAVLTDAPDLAFDGGGSPTVVRTAGGEPQFQLPLGIADFVGREQDVDRIEALLGDPVGVPVVALTGPPGVGKTALALRVGHRLRDRFPDGQWYVQLRGTTEQPRGVGDVLAELLRLGGLAPTAVPEDLGARAAALRSCLSGRRVLLLLDDARDAEQVAPLLPGSDGAAVLVTSRRELWGLTVLHGAHGISVSVLAEDEAIAVIERTAGAARVRAEPDATRELIWLCGSFPLALRVAGANLAARAGVSIERYVDELRSGNRLSRLTVADDPRAAVRAAFDLSYRALDPARQRAFRLVGLIPGADFSTEAAGAMLAVPAEQAGDLLEELAVANLITRLGDDRYDFHDLLRVYAVERADEDGEQDDALRRLFEWYLWMTDAACEFGLRSAARLAARDSRANPFAGGAEGLAWLDAERLNLLALIRFASESGPARFAWELADALRWYLSSRMRLTDWASAAQDGLRAARDTADLGAQASMLGSIGALRRVVGDIDGALGLLAESVELHRAAGNAVGEGVELGTLGLAQRDGGDVRTGIATLKSGIELLRSVHRQDLLDVHLINLGVMQTDLGELDHAIESATESLSCSRSEIARTFALMNRGWVHRLTGDYPAARSDLSAALEIEAKPEPGIRIELAHLAAIEGDLITARRHLIQALGLCRAANRRMIEADALNVLGEVARLDSRPAEATRSHLEALALAEAGRYRVHQTNALIGLATVAYAEDDVELAEDYAHQARDLAEGNGLVIEVCRAHLLLSVLAGAHDRSDDAELHQAEAKALLQQTGYRPPPRWPA